MDPDTIDKLVEFLRRRGWFVVVVLVLLFPGVWWIVDHLYAERLSSMEERLKLCDERRGFAESKLQGQPPVVAAAPASAA